MNTVTRVFPICKARTYGAEVFYAFSDSSYNISHATIDGFKDNVEYRVVQAVAGGYEPLKDEARSEG